jgi:hypothetical protein
MTLMASRAHVERLPASAYSMLRRLYRGRSGSSRRKARRFRLAWPVECGNHRGVTHNISTCGVCIEIERTFAVGERVEFIMTTPRENSAEGGNLHCIGVVVHLDGDGTRPGIGVNLIELAFRGRGSRGVV